MEPLYDAHAHLFVNQPDLYPIDPRGAREGEGALLKRLATDPLPAERLLALWDEAGVAGGAGVQYNTVFKTDNSFLLDASDAHPDRISAVVILDATDPATPPKLAHMATMRGITGLRLYGHPDADGGYPWLDSPAALDTWRVAGTSGLAMVLMYAPALPSPAALGRIAVLAERFPDTRIALDHFGWPRGRSAEEALGRLAALADYANVHFKLTTINFGMFAEDGIDPARFVRGAAELFGAHRMMWGSDVGNTLESYASMADRARNAVALLNAGERRAFLLETGRGLFERKRVHA